MDLALPKLAILLPIAALLCSRASGAITEPGSHEGRATVEVLLGNGLEGGGTSFDLPDQTKIEGTAKILDRPTGKYWVVKEVYRILSFDGAHVRMSIDLDDVACPAGKLSGKTDFSAVADLTPNAPVVVLHPFGLDLHLQLKIEEISPPR